MSLEKLREIEYEYSLDKKEFGKIMVIASLTMLVISIHAIYTIEDAYQQASESQEELETTSMIVNNSDFQSALENMPTGFTIGGISGEELKNNLQYSVDAVQGVGALEAQLGEARNTYQWMVLIGILGLAAGVTSIYI
jgi:hypothetical protein